MLTREEIISKTLGTLAEIESPYWERYSSNLKHALQVRLDTLWQILGEDIDECYWERIEQARIKE